MIKKILNPNLSNDAVRAYEALKLLKDGNARFVEMKLQHPNESAERRADTAAGEQEPFAVVIACSDSRVPVETIFDRGIGDIFVIRIAGNIVMDSSVVGSVEYAVERLNVPLLVVLGHTECGAVKAAVSGVPAEGDIRHIQKTIESVVMEVKKLHPGLKEQGLITAVVKANALQAKAGLSSRSRKIKKAVEQGELKSISAIYDIKTGKIEWLKE